MEKKEKIEIIEGREVLVKNRQEITPPEATMILNIGRQWTYVLMKNGIGKSSTEDYIGSKIIQKEKNGVIQERMVTTEEQLRLFYDLRVKRFMQKPV